MSETESRDTTATVASAPAAASGDSIPPQSEKHQQPAVVPHRPDSPPHRVKGSGIPTMSPRVGKDRNSSIKGLLGTSFGSPRHHGPQRDRAMSLGQYPSSFSGSGNLFIPPPSPYSPSASPITNPATYQGGLNSSMPFMPNLSQSGPTRHAMEAAIHSERERTKQKELEEEGMSADDLRHVLKRERIRMSKLSADLAAMRAAAVQSQAEAEIFEEGRINNLMRRVECLQQEKGRIIIELEREEEMLTNTLQKKLDAVRQEKELLEQQIEREQTSHSDLKSKLTSIRSSTAKQEDVAPKSGEQA